MRVCIGFVVQLPASILKNVKVIFLNVWHGRCGAALAAYIKKEATTTDVFCFQEADISTRQTFRRLLPGFEEHVYDKTFDDEPRFFIATYVKKNLTVTHMHTLLNDSPASGAALVTSLPISTSVVTIVNIHGISFYPDDKLDTDGRIIQSKTIIDFLAGSAGHAIVGGDFNLLPETESVQSFAKAGYHNLITDYAIRTTRNRLAWERFPDNIQYFADYSFTDPRLRVHNFSVPDLEVSDHLPMVIEFDPSNAHA